MVVVGCGVIVVGVEVAPVEELDEDIPVDNMDEDPEAVVGASEDIPEVGSEADENTDEDSAEETAIVEEVADDSPARPLYHCRELRLAAEAPGTAHRSTRKGVYIKRAIKRGILMLGSGW